MPKIERSEPTDQEIIDLAANGEPKSDMEWDIKHYTGPCTESELGELIAHTEEEYNKAILETRFGPGEEQKEKKQRKEFEEEKNVAIDFIKNNYLRYQEELAELNKLINEAK